MYIRKEVLTNICASSRGYTERASVNRNDWA